MRARQRNYITNCSLNATKSYLDAPAYYKNEVLEYNFTLLEGTIKGNYSLSLLNGSGSTVEEFPQYHTSNSKNVIGTLNNLEIYKTGRYLSISHFVICVLYFSHSFFFTCIKLL